MSGRDESGTVIDRVLAARRTLIKDTPMGPIRATIHAPLFYVVAYRHAERLAAKVEAGQRD